MGYLSFVGKYYFRNRRKMVASKVRVRASVEAAEWPLWS